MCAEPNTADADPGAAAERWYLKKTDGSEYGPETLEVMARWAAESRVVSGNLMSRDGKDWLPVEQVPALAMDWTAQLPDGRKYGPFNIRATRDLHAHKVLPGDARLTRRGSDESVTVTAWLEREAAGTQAPELNPAAGAAPLQAEAPTDPAAPVTNAQPAETEASAGVAKTPRRRGRRRHADDAQGDLWSGEPVSGGSVVAGSPQAGDEQHPMDQETAAPEDVEDGCAVRSAATPAAAMETVDAVEPAVPEESAAAPVAADDEPGTTAPTAQPGQTAALLVRVADLEALCATLQKQVREADAARQKAVKETERLRQMSSDAEEAQRAFLKEAQAQTAAAAERSRAADAQKNEVAERLTVSEQRVELVTEELKTARADEARAGAALRGAEAASQRKTQIYEKRIKDLLDERTSLTRLVEASAARIRGLRVGLVAMFVVTTVVVLAAALACWRGRLPASPAPIAGKEQRAPAPAPARPAGNPVALPVITAVPGTQVIYERGGCAIVFDAGVFSAGIAITPQLRPIMGRLAPGIKPYLRQYDLVIEGHSDNQPLPSGSRYASNADLAMARARAVATLLSAEYGLPLASMRATAGAAGRAPYPDGTEASRARNRTVVLRLVRHESR